MITLAKDALVGRGLHREVYVHPDNPNLCIKVVVNGNDKETKREQSYYNLLQRKQINWTCLPKFHGNIETSLGCGAVFDLIRDESGEVSKTFEFYLDHIEAFQDIKSMLISAVMQLKVDLESQNIVAMTIKPKNMVIRQRGAKLDCLIVDNIGNSDLIPIANYCQYFGRLKLNRKWPRLKQLIKTHWPAASDIADAI